MGGEEKGKGSGGEEKGEEGTRGRNMGPTFWIKFTPLGQSVRTPGKAQGMQCVLEQSMNTRSGQIARSKIPCTWVKI